MNSRAIAGIIVTTSIVGHENVEIDISNSGISTINTLKAFLGTAIFPLSIDVDIILQWLMGHGNAFR